MNGIKKLFVALQARPVIGGLEISDSTIHFMRWNGSSWDAKSVRLVPGTVIRGEIKEKKGLVDALNLLRFQILGPKYAKAKEKIGVIVSLSSVNIYTQVFNLPVIEGEHLEKAVQLNIQMASPNGEAENYAGWQLVNPAKENMRLEILSAFLGRDIVDSLADALREGGFIPIAIESRALSLARVVKETEEKFDSQKPIITVSVDASGLDVLVIRSGHLHFDYFNSWYDLQGDQKTISLEAFRSSILRSINQVLNFYNSHWSEPVSEILVSAVGLKDEVINIIKKNFEMPVRELTPSISPPIGMEWFVALGGGLRGRMPRRKDSEISLLGIDEQEEFRREQIVHFTGFWKMLMPITILILIIVIVGSFILLFAIDKKLKTQAVFELGGQELADISLLRSRAQEFNSSIGLLEYVNRTAHRKATIVSSLLEKVSANGIVVDRIQMRSIDVPIELVGNAKKEEDILAFKDSLSSSTMFRDPNLPLTNINRNANGYSFSITFFAKSSNTE